MSLQKKIDFLLSQGYSKEIIALVKKAGVKKHMSWFCQQIKKNEIVINEELYNEIKIANNYLEKLNKNPFYDLKECIVVAKNYYDNYESSKERILHKFNDGNYIILLKEDELFLEGELMANCVNKYYNHVKEKETALLALRDKKDKTLAHFQILKNGMLSQHFEKANSMIRVEYWNQIFDFFKKNKKEELNDEMFGDFKIRWNGHLNSGGVFSLNCIIPNSINISLVKDGVQKKVYDGRSLKNYNFRLINNFDLNQHLEKNEILIHINSMQEEVNKIKNILENINGYEFFISDSLKRKIFGKNFLMKGNDFNLSEIFYVDNLFIPVPQNENVEEPQPMRENEAQEERVELVEEQPVDRQIEEIRVGIVDLRNQIDTQEIVDSRDFHNEEERFARQIDDNFVV